MDLNQHLTITIGNLILQLCEALAQRDAAQELVAKLETENQALKNGQVEKPQGE